MDFLKRLFGAGGAGSSSDDTTGMYFFVRPDGCEEVVRVRVDRNNDLSLADDNTSYFVRKGVRGARCRQPAELMVYFDASRRQTNSEVTNGTLVDEAAYRAWMATQTADETAPDGTEA